MHSFYRHIIYKEKYNQPNHGNFCLIAHNYKQNMVNVHNPATSPFELPGLNP